jgi:inositol-hexakisphosphate kinase
MSTSQSDPENAPPAALVRPELAAEQGLQGRRCSRDAVQNKSEPWPHHHPHVSRSISTSLLTLALAAESEFDPDKTPAPTTFRRPTLPSSAPPRAERDKQSRHDLNVTRSPESSPRKMMVVAPATAGDGRGAGLLAGAPSSPPFPGHDRHDIGSLPTSHRDRFHRSRGRGTSLERTEKERRVQVSPQGAYVNNAGDTALASPPAPRRTPTPSDVIAKNPPTEGVRATYRAWRYPLPGVAAEKAWSIGERGNDSDQGGRVEKLISEAMAGIEPNNRSRKASHSLGFFKEGLPEDRSNKREVRGRGRSKEGLSPAKGSRGLESGKKPGQDTHERDQVQQIRRSDILADEEHPSSSTVEVARPVSLPPPKQATLSLTSDPANGLSQEEGYFDVSDDVEAIPKEQVRTMPAQLLAEIRKHHNLTPGATKGTSFSRSLPVTESERLKDEDDRQEVKSATSSQKDEESNGDGAELAQVKSTDDEDESGEEQISSALFLPHQSSHDSPERERTVFESVAVPHANDQRHLDASNVQQWLEQYEVPSRDLAKKESNSRAMPMPSPVRVKQPSTYTEKESVVPEPGAVPGVDQEIANDSGYTAGGEDLSDDHELIPVGSLKPESQIPSGQNRQVSDEQQDPKRPLEAIELIPYRHQVGGHTTMWRFSKRAVCKQLSNRENEFYEKVERYHPQLLKFLPRFV